MNARDKAKAAVLRRVPDDLFVEEAERRGFSRTRNRALIGVPQAEKLVQRLQQAFHAMTNDHGDQLYAVRSVRHVEQELLEYLRISRDRDSDARGAQ